MNVGGQQNVGVGNQIRSEIPLSPDNIQLISDLAEAAEALVRHLTLAPIEEAEVLAEVETLRAQARSPGRLVGGFDRALQRIGGVIERFPEQAAASTAGSVAATVLLERVSALFPGL